MSYIFLGRDHRIMKYIEIKVKYVFKILFLSFEAVRQPFQSRFASAERGVYNNVVVVNLWFDY
jgi:hypothetical protein